MTIETTFPSLEAMEQLVAMGMDEGMSRRSGRSTRSSRRGSAAAERRQGVPAAAHADPARTAPTR